MICTMKGNSDPVIYKGNTITKNKKDNTFEILTKNVRSFKNNYIPHKQEKKLLVNFTYS